MDSEIGTYTSSADVYALSLIAIELFMGLSLFDDIKNATIFEYMDRRDPVKDLHSLINEHRKMRNINEQKLQLCLDNVRMKRSERKTMKEWNTAWQRVSL